MKLNSTYARLWAIKNDIQNINKNNPAIAAFNQQKITDFYKRNALRLQMVEKKFKSLLLAYAKLDANGEPEIIKVEGKNDEYVFNSDEDRQYYLDQINDFMKIEIAIEV